MEKMTLRELAVPMIKAIDSFNYLLKSHHRRTAVIAYHLGIKLGLTKEELFELIVAASLHDVGALSVQERNMLIKEDVETPQAHCDMGFRMLSSFEVFKRIAQTIKHHHVRYEEALDYQPNEVLFYSHIIHLADRVDILISPDEFILNQRNRVIENIRSKVGEVFHPEVFAAFEEAAKADIFWIEINNVELDQLFGRIDVSIDYDMTMDMMFDFSVTISRFIDFRSKFTAAHSYSVGQLAGLIGGFLGFSEEKRNKLMIAGYLHDIGKIGIDPEILEKNDILTEGEFNLVKLHAYYTGEILKELNKSEWFGEIISWAGSHHEKTDGSGYPYSLSGELNEGVIILAYSDIISALMEDRPYRDAMDVDEAFSLIEMKIAPHLTMDMFNEIKSHKGEIEELVAECQREANSKFAYDV